MEYFRLWIACSIGVSLTFLIVYLLDFKTSASKLIAQLSVISNIAILAIYGCYLFLDWLLSGV